MLDQGGARAGLRWGRFRLGLLFLSDPGFPLLLLARARMTCTSAFLIRVFRVIRGCVRRRVMAEGQACPPPSGAALHDDAPLPASAESAVSADDGAAAHLVGVPLPRLTLPATDGTPVHLGDLTGLWVVYVYPLTGRPGLAARRLGRHSRVRAVAPRSRVPFGITTRICGSRAPAFFVQHPIHRLPAGGAGTGTTCHSSCSATRVSFLKGSFRFLSYVLRGWGMELTAGDPSRFAR